MSAPWRITNRASGSAATATRAAPTNQGTTGLCIRLRSLQCSMSGTSAGTDQLVVRDGAAGTGTIIWQHDLGVVATDGYAEINESDMDLRATPGNALTVEFVNGVANNAQSVNAQGDYVPSGYPAYQS